MPFLKPAWRSLVRRPGFSITVILTLALAIGANSTIFSVIDAVLLKPLPYPEADRLIQLRELNQSGREGSALVAPVRLEEWNRMNRSLVAISGSYFENLTDTTGAVPARIEAHRTAPRFFQVMGTTALLGRTLDPTEEVFGGPASIVISHGFWQERFGGDPSVIGKRMILNGTPNTIVGVMPPWFRQPNPNTQLWKPAQFPPGMMRARNARFYDTVARMRPSVTVAQAQADLRRVQEQLARENPRTDGGWTMLANELKEEKVGGVRKSLWVVFGAVGFVLLIACANIACLMLAQGAGREREFSIRFGLGAERGQVIGQLVAEGLLLALIGAAVGLPLAYGGIIALRKLAADLPRMGETAIDGRIVAFAAVLSTLTTILFALAPAWRSTRRQVAESLAHGGRSQVGSGQRWQRMLVTAQVSLAIVLLVGAGLLMRSFASLQGTDLGMQPDRVLTFRISAGWSEARDAVAARHIRTAEALATIPGVEAVGTSPSVPAAALWTPSRFTIVGRAEDGGAPKFAAVRNVGPGYFAALGIPLRSGATCAPDPTRAGDRVVVNEKFAATFFPGENPIGHSLSIEGGGAREISGIVGNMREEGPTREVPAFAYFCGVLGYWPDPQYLLRVKGDPASYASAVRAKIREIEPNRAVFSVTGLSEWLARSMAQERLQSVLLGLFAAMALGLAALGLYGVLSYFVSQRTREIGLRMALGARPGQVLGQILQQGLAMTVTGVVLGLVGAFGLSRLLGGLLHGVTAGDPLTYTSVAALLIGVALVAAYAPARRATKVDPLTALRDD